MALSEITVAPSLASQSVKPTLFITVHPDDPFLAERKQMFQATGCPIEYRYRTTWILHGDNWELPPGRKLVGRVDDDDVLASDFCERSQIAAPASGQHALMWPQGFVYWRKKIYRLSHPKNQFVALITDNNDDPHQIPHLAIPARWPVITVSDQPGWIWIRHAWTWSSTLARYRQVIGNGIDKDRFFVNLRAVERFVQQTGQPTGDYHEHRRPVRA